MAAPMPCRRLAPVTSATRPVRSDPFLTAVIALPSPRLPGADTAIHDGTRRSDALTQGPCPCEGCHTSVREASEEEFWMRQPGFTASGLLIIAILLLVGMAGVTPAAAWQECKPRGRNARGHRDSANPGAGAADDSAGGHPGGARRNRRRHTRALVSERHEPGHHRAVPARDRCGFRRSPRNRARQQSEPSISPTKGYRPSSSAIRPLKPIHDLTESSSAGPGWTTSKAHAPPPWSCSSPD